MSATSDLWPLALMRERAGAPPPEPDVVRPQTLEAVRDVLRSGRRVVPAGGRSGVCGAVQPETGDVLLDLTALDSIELDAPNLLVTAGAGVNGLELERRLNDAGLTLGHYPSSLPVATVGGLVSTRSSGQESSRYGNVEDMLAGLTVMLPDGSVCAARPAPRSAAGPALHQLFCGAEGGLGVVLEAVFKVRRLPEAVIGRGWRFGSVEAGLDALRETAQRDLRPLVMRLYDPEDSAFQGQFDGCLLVGAAAGPRALAGVESALLGEVVKGAGGEALGEEPWDRWLRHRFDLSAQRLRDMLEAPGAYLDTVEVASTWTGLPGLYQAVKAHLAATCQVALCHFSHASGQGSCAYFTFGGSAADEEAAEAAYLEAWRGTMELTLTHGGSISHHHGVGRARAPWIRAEMGGWWQVWEAVRAALDPGSRMNPSALGGGSAP